MAQTMPKFSDILAKTEADAATGKPKTWLTFDRLFISTACGCSIGFLIIAYFIQTIDPDYFTRRILSTMQPAAVDSVRTGALTSPAAEAGAAMPVPRIVRTREPVPSDYEIVMVFGGEAILATSDELVRAKVGSVVPGLGEILSLEPDDAGGVLRAAGATLRSVAP